MTTYQGSCQCKRVKFEAEIDLSAGTTRCNCTSCFKRRWWGVIVKPAKFRALAGEGELVKVKESKLPGGFCKHCGILPYAFGEAAAWNDGDYVSINVAALDGVDHATLSKVPIKYLDGLHDTWEPITTDISHL
jgi:hypothetical protein